VALPAETAGLKERPAINVKEVLVEVPAEKQGIPPNKMAVRVTKARAPAEM
jgi:hypothetical protein